MSSHRSIDITKSSEIERTHRVQMLETMFEVPSETKLSVRLTGELPIDQKEWNIGLIVGPSGSGKTLLLNEIFPSPQTLEWGAGSVVDDFPSIHSMEDISRICQSVGFNTIPSWLRPYSVLSNGEKFRAEIARRLLDGGDITSIDEFTSVVDRQVAQFACHGVQKFIREKGRRLVAASCHYDIIDWLQPDWILEPGNPCRFSWRSLRPRPPITVSVSRVKYEAWNLFKDFHYMSQDLNKAARCYGLFVGGNTKQRTTVLGNEVRSDDMDEYQDISGSNFRGTVPVRMESSSTTNRIASLCGVLYRPHPKVQDIVGFTRMVTLPDFQGLGLAFVLANTVAAAYKALGKRLHSYPNHPAWIRSYQRSPLWMQVKKAGDFSPRAGSSSTVGGFGGRRCAVFMYVGPASTVEEAQKLIHPEES
jgi:ABC-type lipoprotein export system ATPase subunit